MLPRVNDTAEPAHPVVLFDGVCNLCNTSVQWILRRDRAHAASAGHVPVTAVIDTATVLAARA